MKLLKLYEYTKFADVVDELKEMFPDVKVFKFGSDIFFKNDNIDFNIKMINSDKFSVFDNKRARMNSVDVPKNKIYTKSELFELIENYLENVK